MLALSTHKQNNKPVMMQQPIRGKNCGVEGVMGDDKKMIITSLKISEHQSKDSTAR